jgi:ATP-dependent Clp protease ATP-binding subunit ClpC
MDTLLTDKARRVMELAEQEVRRFNHESIGAEHVLLGLIKDGSGVAAHVLENFGVDPVELLREVEDQLRKLPEPPLSKNIIDFAIEEAHNLNHNYVGTEHLLLSLLREHEGNAARLLAIHGITLDGVRKEIKRTFEDIERAYKVRANKPESEQSN